MSASNSEFIDYYQLLGVPQNATLDVIKKAYKKQALRKHPDRNPDNPNAGEEFAILVTAKEILSDSKLRSEFDLEFNARSKLQEERRKEKVRRHQMSKVRREQIERLEAMEKKAESQRRESMQRRFRSQRKRDAVKEELDRFRAMIQEQQQKAIEEEVQREKERKQNERNKRRSVTVRVDRKRSDGPYSENEIKSIFKVYGKISEIVMARDGAEIRFKKSKSVRRAIEDEEALKKEFCLILVFGENAEQRERERERIRSKKEEDKEKRTVKGERKRWREWVDRRSVLSHEMKTEMVWNEVQQFLKRNDYDPTK